MPAGVQALRVIRVVQAMLHSPHQSGSQCTGVHEHDSCKIPVATVCMRWVYMSASFKASKLLSLFFWREGGSVARSVSKVKIENHANQREAGTHVCDKGTWILRML
jgi:hypothetical protein